MRFLTVFLLLIAGPAAAADRPNILWLTTEDIGPHLGCYGDPYADTPHLDKFAQSSVRYLHAWSNAPVCAPARTTIITGCYPSSLGAEHMRSQVSLPPGFLLTPQLLRPAGYHCINPGKEDYNVIKPGEIWDKSDSKQPWDGLENQQPFYAVFNHTGTHESKIRKNVDSRVHDVAQAPLPPYHPDTPESRADWALYYDNITDMDRWFADHLAELNRRGLAENTIVFFYGDHGSGMPRHKRSLNNSGLHVPLLIHIPEKYRELAGEPAGPGETSNRLVGFVDLLPTMLSLAGVQPPEHLQGAAFLGPDRAPDPEYAFGFRGRMDERYDLVRTVRNHRYQYIRNYMPQRPAGQHNAYMFETPTTRRWKALYDAGQLNDDQKQFWEPRAGEELYDLKTDPHQLHNLASDPAAQQTLSELRTALRNWQLETRDVGLLFESERAAIAPDLSPYEIGHDENLYPLERILAMADIASLGDESDIPKLIEGLGDSDRSIRFWAATGLLIRREAGVSAAREALQNIVRSDDSPAVRVVAAEALGQFGDEQDLEIALQWLAEAVHGNRHGGYVAVFALNAVDHLGERAAPLKSTLAQVPTKGKWVPLRGANYVPRLLDAISQNWAP